MSKGDHQDNASYKSSRILVTGGTGSIGIELVRELLRIGPKEVRVLSNDENGLFEASNFLEPSGRLNFYLGDVRDPRSIERVIKGCDVVFHAAALKHVIFCEQNPYEAISTNIVGTQNMIDAAVKHSVKRFVFISTDKAVNPVSAMGATKLLGERLIFSASKLARQPVFSTVRFGNVLGSRGSVALIFEKQVREGKAITVTDPSMTRFIMAPSDASALILRAGELSRPGELFVLKMKTVRIGDLAEACKAFFGEMYGRDPRKVATVVTGPQAGEKMHEQLMTDDEAAEAHDLGDYLLINPSPSRDAKAQRAGAGRAASNLYPVANRAEIIAMLKKVYAKR